jgi:Protein of unknown function (DUF1275)
MNQRKGAFHESFSNCRKNEADRVHVVDATQNHLTYPRYTLGDQANASRYPYTTLGRESMLLLLTLAAASVDAISYLGLGHVFTAMMTGNTVLLGLALAQGEVLAALRSILALIGFAIGVLVGAIIVERESDPAEWPAAVTAALAFETLVLAIFAATSTLFDSTRARSLSTCLLSCRLSSWAFNRLRSAASASRESPLLTLPEP